MKWSELLLLCDIASLVNGSVGGCLFSLDRVNIRLDSHLESGFIYINFHGSVDQGTTRIQ